MHTRTLRTLTCLMAAATLLAAACGSSGSPAPSQSIATESPPSSPSPLTYSELNDCLYYVQVYHPWAGQPSPIASAMAAANRRYLALTQTIFEATRGPDGAYPVPDPSHSLSVLRTDPQIVGACRAFNDWWRRGFPSAWPTSL
jgi:hypothetical protein